MNAMRQLLNRRISYEAMFVILASLGFGLGIGFLGALAMKFQIAFCLGLFGLTAMAFVPHKRALCLFLWVLIQPLSIEKIIYTAPGLIGNLRGLEIVMNAGDLILVALAGLVIVQHAQQRQAPLVWDRKSSLLLALILWGAISYLIHLLFFQTGFTSSAPFGLLHMTRNLLFVMIILSAIQTRADLIWVLIGVLINISLQSVLVTLSFFTHEVFNFMRLLGGPTLSQTYAGSGDVITRAVGTLGVANQQGLFHAMFTFLLIGFFGVKNTVFRNVALLAMLASFVGVIFTFSRGAWLTMILATITITAIFIKRREISPKSWLIGSMVMMLFVMALSAVIQPIIDRLTKGDDGATGSRIRMIELAYDLWKEYPILGVGPSEYVEAGLKLYPPGYKENEWVALGNKAIVPPLGRIELARAYVPGYPELIVPLPVHNKYLLTLCELGLVGLILWLCLFYEFYQDARRCSCADDPLLRYLGVAGVGIVIVAVVYMNVDLFADDKTLQILLFPLVVVSAAARLAARHSESR